MEITRNRKQYDLVFIEHMLHINNLENIFTYGLLSHNEAHSKGLVKKDISMDEVQKIRAKKTVTINGNERPLHDLVPFYFESKNPMMNVRKNIQHELVLLLVSANVIKNSPGSKFTTIFSDGNAASQNTNFFSRESDLCQIPFEILRGEIFLENKEEWKRKMCSEVLIYPSLPISEIKYIICQNIDTKSTVLKTLEKFPSTAHIQVIKNSNYFFRE